MKHALTRLTALLLALAVTAGAATVERPNIILILADDLGWSDLGCYGGEIQTPNLDRLAANGLRFTQFYNSAKCAPTRTSLMSGQYWQDCGKGIKRGITMGQAMRGAGYATLAVGKWHLDGNPFERGFDHYFGHLSGASDYFKGSPSHRLDGRPFKPKDKNFYTTDANADFAIQFITDSRKQHPDKPFFIYLAFNAPHVPLQAWPEDIAKYRGKYRSMAIYAAMVDRMDQAIGRVLAKVKELGQENNTLVMFLSDNGGNPYDGSRTGNLGDRTAHYEYGLGWAHVSNTPFAHYKRNMFNGGACTPFIASWPPVIKQTGTITDERGHIIDLMATVMDVAGSRWPQEFDGKPLDPLTGKSLLTIFAGATRVPPAALYFQLYDHRAVVAGDWKLVSDCGRPWALFKLTTDRTELHDRAQQEPEQFKQLEQLWTKWWSTKSRQRLKAAGGEPTYRQLNNPTDKSQAGGGESDE